MDRRMSDYRQPVAFALGRHRDVVGGARGVDRHRRGKRQRRQQARPSPATGSIARSRRYSRAMIFPRIPSLSVTRSGLAGLLLRQTLARSGFIPSPGCTAIKRRRGDCQADLPPLSEAGPRRAGRRVGEAGSGHGADNRKPRIRPASAAALGLLLGCCGCAATLRRPCERRRRRFGQRSRRIGQPGDIQGQHGGRPRRNQTGSASLYRPCP